MSALSYDRIYADRAQPAVVVRIDRVVSGQSSGNNSVLGTMTDADVSSLMIGMTNEPSRRRDARVIAQFDSRREYLVEADIRGATMVRLDIDNQPRDERMLQNGDRVRRSVREVARLWASNAGNVRLQVAGTAVELGEQGEVVAALIRWRETDDRRYALELLPMY